MTVFYNRIGFPHTSPITFQEAVTSSIGLRRVKTFIAAQAIHKALITLLNQLVYYGFFYLSKAGILKLNKDKLQNCVLDIKNNISPGLTIKDFVLNSFNEIKADIKQLQDNINEMKDDFTPVTNQNVSGSVSNNLLNLEKVHYELQQYSGRNNVEILGLPDIFTGDRLTEKIVELCNDFGVTVKVRDIGA